MAAGYASTTHYESLYATDYFGHSENAASFDTARLPPLLARLCAELSTRRMLDVGGGSGLLRRLMAAHDVEVTVADYAPPGDDGLRLDLSAPVEGARLEAEVRARTGGAHLTTCFDVLEHLDPEHLAAALANLNALVADRLLASISTRPSSRDNRFHATVAPRATWLELMAAAGFEPDERQPAEALSAPFPGGPDDESTWIVRHWLRVDPFGDAAAGEPWYVLFRKVRPVRADLAAFVAEVLDIGHRAEKRRRFKPPRDLRLYLNIHHLQDFLVLRPILDVLDRTQVEVLHRRGFWEPKPDALIDGFFARCGVRTRAYRLLSELPWRALAPGHLLSAAESTVGTSHVLSQQVVAAARLSGWPTTLLQHGVWAEAFPGRVVSFASDAVLAWSQEHAAGFSTTDAHVLGRRAPRGVLKPGQVLLAGSPKHAECEFGGPVDLVRRKLGRATAAYRRCVLVGTNLHWGPHGAGAAAAKASLACLIARTPDVLFIVKLHPSERVEAYEDLRAPNVVLLDEYVCLAMDLQIPRLLASVDAVVCSLSSLLVDAAYCGTPVLQYETGSALSYAGLAPTPFADIEQLLQGGDEALAARGKGAALKRVYASVNASGFYTALSRRLEAPVSEAFSDVEAAAIFSLASEAERNWDLAYGGRAAADAAERQAVQQEALIDLFVDLVGRGEAPIACGLLDRLPRDPRRLPVDLRTLRYLYQRGMAELNVMADCAEAARLFRQAAELAADFSTDGRWEAAQRLYWEASFHEGFAYRLASDAPAVARCLQRLTAGAGRFGEPPEDLGARIRDDLREWLESSRAHAAEADAVTPENCELDVTGRCR